MPIAEINGARLHYELRGSGPETILFAHGLLWSGDMFAHQVAALESEYRCLTFDFRGQGRSGVTASGYDMDTLAADAAALIESLGVGPCHVAGLSMGGFIAMRLGARRPELVRSLILLATSAEAEPAGNIPRYRLLNFVARWFGLGLVAGQVMPIMFGRKFLEDPARRDERARHRTSLSGNDRIGISRAVRGVIDRRPILPELGRITAPTLIIVGEQDVATVPARSEQIRDAIRGSRLVVIPGAGHSSTMEEPLAVTAAIRNFLARLPAAARRPSL